MVIDFNILYKMVNKLSRGLTVGLGRQKNGQVTGRKNEIGNKLSIIFASGSGRMMRGNEF